MLGLINLFLPLLHGRYLGDIGDTRFNEFILEHQYKLLIDKAYPGSYASAAMWFPDYSENSLAGSDLLAGAEPFYFLPRLFLSRDHALQAFFIIAATLNFLSFLWLCREVGVDSWLVAALAAWVFAFGMHRVQQTVHVQFFVEFWGVAFMGFLIRFLRSPARITLFWMSLFLGLQAVTAPYTAVFYALAGMFFVGIYLALAGRAAVLRVWNALRRDGFGMAGAIAIAAAPVLTLLIPYLRNLHSLSRPWAEVFQGIPSADYWFLAFQGTLWWFVAGLAGRPHETYFLGAAFLLLWIGSLTAFAASRSWRAGNCARLALTFGSLALVLYLISVRLTPDWSLWRLVYNWFPGAKSIRAIWRVGLAVNLCVLVAGALFLDGAAQRLRGGKRRALVYGCIALAMVENCLALGLAHSVDSRYVGMYTYASDWYAAEYAEMRELLREAKSGYVYNDPRAGYDYTHEDTVRLVAQELDIPVVNGICVADPPGYGPRMHPRDVLAKGVKFDFTGFRYLVPVSDDAAIQSELRQAGLTFQRRGNYFVAYSPFSPGVAEPLYDVDFRLLEAAPETLKPGGVAPLRVLVTNRSNYAWQPAGIYPTQPGFQIFNRGVDRPVVEGATNLPQVLFPQESAVVTLSVRAPQGAGQYLVCVRMVRQRICWFKPAESSRDVQFPISVAP